MALTEPGAQAIVVCVFLLSFVAIVFVRYRAAQQERRVPK